MNIALKPESEKFNDEQVRAGHYESAEDLVEDALARLRQDSDEGLDPDDLAAIQEGMGQIARGESVTLEQVREHFTRRGVEPRPPQGSVGAVNNCGTFPRRS